MVSLIGTYDAQGKSQQANRLESNVIEIAERLSARKNPLGQQVLNLLRQDGFTRSNGRAQSSSIQSTATQSFAMQADKEKCWCVEAVVLSETNGYDFSRYLNQAMSSVQQNWRGLVGRDQVKTGRVVVRFNVAQDGRPLNLRLVSSSGEDLERAATEVVQLSSPLPKLPVDLKADQLDLQIAFGVVRPVSLRGRATVEGAGNPTPPSFGIAFAGNQRAQAQIQNGAFNVSLPAGQYRVAPIAIPGDYYLKTIVLGSLDLQQNLLTVRDGQETGEIVVTLGVRPPPGANQ
jgi:TonB family protein